MKYVRKEEWCDENPTIPFEDRRLMGDLLNPHGHLRLRRVVEKKDQKISFAQVTRLLLSRALTRARKPSRNYFCANTMDEL